ncbi:MAG: hypothetical protein MJ051_00165 [Akkermansia sp.]|nr:hypothetical protein [Akkermansia sp.]
MKRLVLPALLCLAALPALAEGVAALTIRDGNVCAYDAGGSYRGTISGSGNAVDAQTDGSTIAVLLSNGTITLYDASGSYRGTLHASGCTRIQVVRGLVICHSPNGHAVIYSANGSYCGSV